MSDQLELSLVDDYAESYEPGRPSCADCDHCDEGLSWRGWKTPSRCPVLGREVSRSTGRCGQFVPRSEA